MKRIFFLLFAIILPLGNIIAQNGDNFVDTKPVVALDPLYFVKNGASVTDETENQRLWNELMRYKLWGTETVVFNAGGFRITEPNGYTGSGANGKVIFNNGWHTLGGPIITAGDLQISYPENSADYDTLLVGPVRAGWLTLTNWYDAPNAKYEGIYCFEGQIYFPGPDRFTNPNRNENNEGDAVLVTKRFIANVHKGGGKIYADWDKDMLVPGTSDVIVPGLPDLFNNDGSGLDGHFENCPTDDVPRPEKELSVPLMHPPSNWGPAINASANVGNIVFVHVPPITEYDLEQSPKKVWYDQYVEDLRASGSTGLIIYIVMPSNKWNANKKEGRLTRIFSRDGFNVTGSADDLRIQVAIVNDNAVWNSSTQMWENLNEPEWNPSTNCWRVSDDKPYWDKNTGWHNLDKLNINPVADSNYAGNLLFYTPVDVNWDSMVDIHYQGTFMTAGNFTIEDHINIAGQLIAGKTLKFESNVNGEFRYVPFNPAEIKADIFSSDTFIEKETYWYPMNFSLTDYAYTDVSFDYSLAFFGTDVDIPASLTGRDFADIADLDLADKTHPMPLCSKGETGHVVIAKNYRVPTKETMPYIKVNLDGHIENDEYMLFKITNLNGAAITGRTFDGGILVKLKDDDNKPPYFVDVDKVKLAVVENKTQAKAGTIKAEDKEGDSYVFDIVGGTAQDLFTIGYKSGVVALRNGIEPFDYEEWKQSNTTYTIKVEVCDSRATSFNKDLCSEHTFNVKVGDTNETPYFTNTVNEIHIAEGAPFSSDEVVSDDYDKKEITQNQTFLNNKYEIIGGDKEFFDITSDGLIYPKNGIELDYEVRQEYEIEVRVRDANKDGDGNYIYPDLYDDQTFKVLVTAAPTAISAETTDEVKVWANNRTLYIKAPVGTQYRIAGLDGRPIVASATKTAKDEILLPEAGCYVLTINNKSYKIIVY